MRLRYETGIGTFVQFLVGTVLSFVGGIASIIGGCRGSDAGDCTSNTLVSLILILLTALWLAFVWVLGYAAQDRRSWRLALILIAAEFIIAMVALFDAMHHPTVLDLITNLINLAVAVWVILLAWRLLRARGGRITHATPQRARRRPVDTKRD